VAVGGAADHISFALGNALVGNPPDVAALEFSLSGPTLRARAELACAISGAPFDVRKDGTRIPVGKTFMLRQDETLQIGRAPAGVRGYLCIRGGLGTPPILGSRSGLEALRAGVDLPCSPGTIHGRFLPAVESPQDSAFSSALSTFHFPLSTSCLRVLDGLQ